MRGRYPKDPEIRQRRNRASTRATLSAVPDDEPRRRAPSLPTEPKGREWHAETRRWWRNQWASPMASQYLDSDVDGLRRIAVLMNDFWHRPKLSTFEAINRALAMFGQTPMDRKRLEWQIEQTERAANRMPPQRPSPAESDPLAPLRAIK